MECSIKDIIIVIVCKTDLPSVCSFIVQFPDVLELESDLPSVRSAAKVE